MPKCEYGCNQEATYKLGKKYCCSPSLNQCPAKKARALEARKKVIVRKPKQIETTEFCDFCKKEIAKFKFNNGRLCCQDDWHKCPSGKDKYSKIFTEYWSDKDKRKKLSEDQKKRDLIAKPIPHNGDEKCFYCKKDAHFWFKTNNRYCCSDRIERCPIYKEEASKRMIEKWKDEKFREFMISTQIYDDNRSKNVSDGLKRYYKTDEGKQKAKDLALKNSEDRKGKTYDELFGEEKANEIKEMVKDIMVKKWENPDFRLKMEEIMSSEERRKKISNSIKEFYSSEDSIETRAIMSQKKKEQWEDQNSSYNSTDFRNKKSIESTKKWGDSEFVNKVREHLIGKKTKSEQLLESILNTYFPNQFTFVGDLSFIIGTRNPDFIDEKNNKLIELFGDYWHSEKVQGIDPIIHEKERVSYFKSHNYDTLVIWENELNDIDGLKNKINNFILVKN